MRSERERLSGGYEDEIDLFELITSLWKKKFLIVGVTAVVSGIALAYALLATPVYEAKIFVQPPSQNDIAPLNYGRGEGSELEPFTVKSVSGIYLRTLQSESLSREFFRKYYLPSLNEEQRNGSQDSLYAQFKGILTVGVASKDTPDRFFVMARLPNPRQAAEWVTRYAEIAGNRAKAEVIKDARADAVVKADNLEQLVKASRESARKEREDRIAQLTEALRVARSIGLEKPPIISNNLSSELSAGMDGSLTYMRGSKAIEAEIENLRSRLSDDPFIDKLRQSQESM
ncbi:Tyrosine-protein kinase etk [Pseudomonas putida]|nr:Tyrosine-protein kinase etk [Pseudomonas putida]CAB5575788.1 Tyrosine-protein kinase etk [Pseudomonas putida]CAB5619365.1 Tyrosine-protein kinase etk [Pseudomonas putida]CAB5619425.1 Tyrosine-protein kinase etk [Pseudomonas putida]CAB5699826.1 Tyrosine-protein kinase etk [Pseudomonas putida]